MLYPTGSSGMPVLPLQLQLQSEECQHQTWVLTASMQVSRCGSPSKSHSTRVDKDLRPISHTPVLYKSLELHIKKWTLDLIKHLIVPHQYGSLPGCSTTQSLIELLHSWLAALEKPDRVVQILFLDFRKTIDKVDHTILLRKLASVGIPEILIQWVPTKCKDWFL